MSGSTGEGMKWEDLTETQLIEALPIVNGNFHLLCSFLALLPVAATVKDPLGRILYANRTAMRLYNRKPNELIGKTIDQVITIDDPKIVREIRRLERKVISSGKAEIVFQQLGNKVHPIRHSVLKFPFFDSDGDPIVASLIFSTQPKQLEST
jgi:PAS domain-containing protein